MKVYDDYIASFQVGDTMPAIEPMETEPSDTWSEEEPYSDSDEEYNFDWEDATSSMVLTAWHLLYV